MSPYDNFIIITLQLFFILKSLLYNNLNVHLFRILTYTSLVVGRGINKEDIWEYDIGLYMYSILLLDSVINSRLVK